MRKLKCLAGLAVMIVGAVALRAEAQPLRRLQENSGELKSCVQALGLYPKDVRQAILVVSQYPDLVASLAKAGPGASPDLSNYPANVQSAAKSLLATPQALQNMAQHPRMTMMIGKAYQSHPEQVEALAQSTADQQSQAENASVQGWTNRLQNDPAALQQLLAAGQAYSQQQGTDASAGESTQTNTNTEAYAAATYGAYQSSSGTTNVYYTPSAGFTRYALDNSDRYPALANQVVDQYQHETNTDEFNNAVNDWHGSHGGQFDKTLLTNPDNRSERLGQAATYQRNLNTHYAGRDITDNDRRSYFDANADKYNHLGTSVNRGDFGAANRDAAVRVNRDDPARVNRDDPARRANEDRPGDRNRAETDRARTDADKAGREKETDGRAREGQRKDAGKQGNVTRKQPSHDQQVSRASDSHKSSWNRSDRNDDHRSGGDKKSGDDKKSGSDKRTKK